MANEEVQNQLSATPWAALAGIKRQFLSSLLRKG
ncbi:hypothetical protein FHS21_002507 [Phyllobacterium trifolii]|uniref:Uncharacterized protein n=1 Tax=Phyllobacterium trifolii TaxID=300193 RepID=A0A839UAY4_9HYPH|nr:hypothetical protein [Phyllobacterium trifolii]